MSRTITAMFNSRSEAESARQQLESLGADARIIDQASSSSGSTDEGRDGGGFWDSVKDFFAAEDDYAGYEEGVRRGAFLLCANVSDDQADRACSLLESSGAIDLDRHEQELRSSGWSGRHQQGERFGHTDDTSAERGRVVEEQRIPIVEEQLKVGKREFERGGARVRSYVEEKPVHETVNLRDEHVEVERRPVDQRIDPSELENSDLLREREVEMRETAEEPIIGKEARVKEEVVLKKTAEERQEHVEDTIRRTNVEVDDAEPRDRETEGGNLGRY
ncbi:MAG: YsnF/AvaK domain-containing protein [Bacillota bacterium]